MIFSGNRSTSGACVRAFRHSSRIEPDDPGATPNRARSCHSADAEQPVTPSAGQPMSMQLRETRPARPWLQPIPHCMTVNSRARSSEGAQHPRLSLQIRPHKIGAAFADHDAWRVGVARNEARHDRGVSHIEPRDDFQGSRGRNGTGDRAPRHRATIWRTHPLRHSWSSSARSACESIARKRLPS